MRKRSLGRSTSIAVRLRSSELAKVRRAARAAGLSVSEWVRKLAGREVRRSKGHKKLA